MDHTVSLKLFIPRGRSRMHPLQWQLKSMWSAASGNPTKSFALLEECRESTGWWLQQERWSLGIPLQVPPPSLLYTNASMTCWGAHLQDLTPAGVWSQKEEKKLCIILLEMKAVQLPPIAFLPRVLGESVILMSNNATVVVFLKKQEGMVSS